MRVGKETLYFVGHEGLIKTLDYSSANIMYMPDANLVLSLLKSTDNKSKLSERHKHFISVSKQSVNQFWLQDKKYIPVNPVLALMELTKQNEAPNYTAYLKLYNEFFESKRSINPICH